MDIRVLDHPLDRKDLIQFTGPGVYLFLSENKKRVEDQLSQFPEMLTFLRTGLEVFYIGKAKRLNQRLKTYRLDGASSSGDWYKRNQLAITAKSILIIQAPSHFEACLLELLLIRLLDPKLNYMSTQPGKLFYVQQDKISKELCAGVRRRAGCKTWGCVRLKSDLRSAFEAFHEVFEVYDSVDGVIKVRPADSTYGRSRAARRWRFYVGENHRVWVQEVLRGRQQGVMEALWKTMRTAASQQQFHHAAHLRDLFFALRRLQIHLRRSRKIMRQLKSNRFVIGFDCKSQARDYVLRQYTIVELALPSSNSRQESPSFFGLMKMAIELFKSEITGLSQTERLRVNFEFLRLMLWWLEHQPEECLIRSARND